MAWIDVIDEQQAEGELADLYADLADPQFGRVDRIMSIHSLHPGGMRGSPWHVSRSDDRDEDTPQS